MIEYDFIKSTRSQFQFNFNDMLVKMHPKRKAVRSAAKNVDTNDVVAVFVDNVRRVQRQRRFERNFVDREFTTRPRLEVDDGDSRLLRRRCSADDDQFVALDEVRRVTEPWNEAGNVERSKSISPRIWEIGCISNHNNLLFQQP